MKTIKLFMLAALFCSAIFESFSYSVLKVQDPKSTWRYGRGKIEEATITVQPKGIYSEVSYYLTFSSGATSMTSSSDTLEVVLNFQLPQQSLVTDSWLWIENDIIKADILDKWTATNIYEGIVKRRKDPSILTKSSSGFELRIFPLIGNQTRKVKMTFLLQNKWLPDGTFGINLPFEILTSPDNAYCDYYNNCSSGVPDQAKILVKGTSYAGFNKMNSTSGKEFYLNPYSDSLLKNYKETIIQKADFEGAIDLSFKPASLKNGIFLNTVETGNNEGYYQMVLFPGKALNLPIKRKTAFLIDFDASKSRITSTQIFSNLKMYIENNFTDKDSFAIFFAGFNITGTGNTWIKGDSSSKANAFKNLFVSMIKDYSNLTPLLSKGAEFLKTNSGGDIILIEASEHGFSPSNSNSLINDYVASLPAKSKFSTIDLGTYSQAYYSSVSYYGDGYFYSNLSRLTKGLFMSFYDSYSYDNYVPRYIEMLEKAVSNGSGLFTSFESHTTLLNGFCSGRQNFNAGTQEVNLNSPILQVGKYNGTLPFIIQTSGIYNGKAFYRNFSVEEGEISKSDTITQTLWEGKYILDRETLVQNNFIISDIIDHSLQNRVLSLYTAFLALEPAQGGQVCATCPKEDDSQVVVTGLNEELYSVDSLTVSVFPSPASKQATIVIKDYLYSSEGSLNVYNSIGGLVNTIDLRTISTFKGRAEINLDLENAEEMPNGTYFLVYSNGTRTKKGKFIVLR